MKRSWHRAMRSAGCLVRGAAWGDLSAVDPLHGTIRWHTSQGGDSRSTPLVGSNEQLFWGHRDTFVVISPTGALVDGWDPLSGNQVFGGSPAMSADGTIYVVHDALWSLSPINKTVNWVYPFGGIASHGSPAIGPTGTIYTGSGDGYLYAFNPNGTVQWQKQIAAFDSPALATDGTIYIGTSLAKLYAFTPVGTQQWVFTSDEVDQGEPGMTDVPAIGPDGTIYFGVSYANFQPDGPHQGGTLYALHPNGTLKWKYPIGHYMSPIAVDVDGRAFVCARLDWCYALDASGKLLWKYPTTAGYWSTTSPLLIGDDTLVILDGAGTLYGLTTRRTIYLPLVAQS
jgi:large repetitive protein